MENVANVVLIVHLIIAIFLIAVVLLQRSEGGALGIGGGGGGMVSSRGAATALSKVTWALAIGFICTSMLLTYLAGADTGTGSVFDTGAPAAEGGIDGDAIPLPDLPATELPLPGTGGDIPLPGLPQPDTTQ